MGEPAESSGRFKRCGEFRPGFLNLPKDSIELLKQFHVELLHFNAKVNLIGRGTERDADEAHFADSIMGGQMVIEALHLERRSTTLDRAMVFLVLRWRFWIRSE